MTRTEYANGLCQLDPIGTRRYWDKDDNEVTDGRDWLIMTTYHGLRPDKAAEVRENAQSYLNGLTFAMNLLRDEQKKGCETVRIDRVLADLEKCAKLYEKLL